jgi:hypothetical protein
MVLRLGGGGGVASVQSWRPCTIFTPGIEYLRSVVTVGAMIKAELFAGVLLTRNWLMRSRRSSPASNVFVRFWADLFRATLSTEAETLFEAKGPVSASIRASASA